MKGFGVFGVFRAVGGVVVGWGWVVSVPGCGAGFGGRVVLGVVRGSGPVAGVAGSCGLVVRAVGGRVAGWRGERPGLGVDAVTVEGRAGIGRLRAGLRGARVGDGFLEGAVVFFARGSGWAWDAAASAAVEATASSGPCAGGWRYPGPAAVPGGAVPGPRRPGGGRTRRPSSLSGSSTGLNGPAVAAGSARGRPEAASRPLARRGPRDRGGGGSGCPSASRGRAGTDRAGAGSSGPARPAGRGVAAAAPGMRRVGGIAHGPARRGSAHPAVVVDCFPGEGSSGARSPVACAPGSSPGPRPWPRGARPPIRGVGVLRSGRGARCAWAGCTGFMAGRGVLPSVGRAGSRCGNAAAESFTAVSREELVNRGVHSTRNHAIRDVTARTGSRCNHRRLHSAIDHRTPDQADTEWRQQHKTAARDHPSTTA